MASAGIPDDGLLGPPRNPYGLLWSLKETMDRHAHTHSHTAQQQQQPSSRSGFSAGKAPLSVHQSQEDMGEVRAWQIQGIIRPLSSLQLSLTKLVGEDEGDRREFMTYPCNHRGGLRHSEMKHMGVKREKWRRGERKKEDIFMKMEKRVKWRRKEILEECYMLQRLLFDCCKIIADWPIYADFLWRR